MEPLLIGLMIFGTVLLGMLALANRSVEREVVAVRLRTIALRRAPRSVVLTLPFYRRALLPLVRSSAQFVTRAMPPKSLGAVRMHLAQAGQRYSDPVGWVLRKWLGAGALGALGYVVGNLQHRPVSAQLIGAAALAALGYLWPELSIRRRIRLRQARILRELPETLDLLSISVEAGLGLDQALEVVSTRRPGPLSDEVRGYLDEVRLGSDRREALRGLGDRTGLEELISFAGALVQATEFGVSIATVLRLQASEVRKRRRQRIEERAMKTPVKMLFPIVFLILPAVFVAAAGPGLIRIYHEFINPSGPGVFSAPQAPVR
jgi:tight adherence protein C